MLHNLEQFEKHKAEHDHKPVNAKIYPNPDEYPYFMMSFPVFSSTGKTINRREFWRLRDFQSILKGYHNTRE